MSDYTKTTNFTAKDALTTGNPAKIAKGTEVDAEFDAISTSIATKYDSGDTVALGDGTSSLPGLTFASDLDIGLYRAGTNNFRAVAASTTNAWFTLSGMSIFLNSSSTAAGPIISFVGDSDTGFYQPTGVPNTVGIAAGGTAAALFSSGGTITLGLDTSSVLTLNTVVGTTVGAAGAASALPATPAGYINLTINGSTKRIPYYN